jgi:hypothetical protein
MLADWVELQGAATHPIIRLLPPRAPGNGEDYRIRWEDLGELAPEEFRSKGKAVEPEPQ